MSSLTHSWTSSTGVRVDPLPQIIVELRFWLLAGKAYPHLLWLAAWDGTAPCAGYVGSVMYRMSAVHYLCGHAHPLNDGHVGDVPKKTICTSKLDDLSTATFRKAVQRHYWSASGPFTSCRLETAIMQPLLATACIQSMASVCAGCAILGSVSRLLQDIPAQHMVLTAMLPQHCMRMVIQDMCSAGMSCSWMIYQCGVLLGRPQRRPRTRSTSTSTPTRALTSTTTTTGCAHQQEPSFILRAQQRNRAEDQRSALTAVPCIDWPFTPAAFGD